MPVVRYSFLSEGAEAVKRDLTGIAAAAKAAVQRRTNTESRAVAASEKQTAKAAEREARAAQKVEAAKARAAEKTEQQKTRLAEREAQNRVRVAEREAAAVARVQKQQAQHAARVERERRRLANPHRLRNTVQDGTTRGAFVGTLAANAAGAGIGFGVDAAGRAIRSRLENDDKARRLAISGRQAGQSQVDHRALLEDAERTARTVKGTRAGDILDAQSRYVSMTGDLEGSRNMARTWAVASKATGASVEDMAATSATLRDKFGIQDPAAMKDAMGALIFQGKSGAFEMADMARYATEMGASAERFGLKGTKGVKQFGSLAQIARMSTGSGAEASTAMQAMLRQLVSKSDEIKKTTGARVFADAGKTRTNDIFDVLTQTIKGAKGNQRTLQGIFGDEGMRGVSKMVSTFNDAAAAAGKSATEQERLAAGEAALRAMFAQTSEAGGNWAEVVKDAAQQSGSASDQLITKFESLGSGIADSLEPAISTFVENFDLIEGVLEPLVGQVGDTVEVFGQLADQLRSWGLLKPKEEPAAMTRESAHTQRNRATSRLAALDTMEKTTGLTGKQKSERRKLRDQLVEADQWLADNGDNSKTVAQALTAAAVPQTRGTTASERERQSLEAAYGPSTLDEVMATTSGAGWNSTSREEMLELTAGKGDMWRSTKDHGPGGIVPDLTRAALGGDAQKVVPEGGVSDVGAQIAALLTAIQAAADAQKKAGAAAEKAAAAQADAGRRAGLPGGPNPGGGQ